MKKIDFFPIWWKWSNL